LAPPVCADPFADAAAQGPTAAETKKSKKAEAEDFAVHVRMQQRNGRKSLTTVQGLPEAFDYKKILKALKKGEFAPRHVKTASQKWSTNHLAPQSALQPHVTRAAVTLPAVFLNPVAPMRPALLQSTAATAP
jgi:translation initiation factor SUI1